MLKDYCHDFSHTIPVVFLSQKVLDDRNICGVSLVARLLHQPRKALDTVIPRYKQFVSGNSQPVHGGPKRANDRNSVSQTQSMKNRRIKLTTIPRRVSKEGTGSHSPWRNNTNIQIDIPYNTHLTHLHMIFIPTSFSDENFSPKVTKPNGPRE